MLFSSIITPRYYEPTPLFILMTIEVEMCLQGSVMQRQKLFRAKINHNNSILIEHCIVDNFCFKLFPHFHLTWFLAKYSVANLIIFLWIFNKYFTMFASNSPLPFILLNFYSVANIWSGQIEFLPHKIQVECWNVDFCHKTRKAQTCISQPTLYEHNKCVFWIIKQKVCF